MSDTGYKQQQLDAGSNIAKAQLNLQFKPWFKPIESSSDEEDATITFHGMKINESSMVKVLFRANPKPSEEKVVLPAKYEILTEEKDVLPAQIEVTTEEKEVLPAKIEIVSNSYYLRSLQNKQG